MESKSVQGEGSHLLIADDHAIFAEALRVYLEKTHTVVGLVRDGRAMVAEAMRLRPGFVLKNAARQELLKAIRGMSS
jgi:DNA-binding NarL/FixJ family response regulator